MTTSPFLVVDIGGTNTRVGLATGSTLQMETIRRFRNGENASLDAVLSSYLEGQNNHEFAGVAVALAGPVQDDQGMLTNLDWVVRPGDLRARVGCARAVILNDLQAQGHAIGHLSADTTPSVFRGAAPVENGTSLVVNVGTGFNVAPVYDTDRGRIVPPSESGHISLPVASADDLDLMRFIEKAEGFAAVEDVLSGRGLVSVYRWHVGHDGGACSDAAAIMQAAADESDPDASRAVASFVRMMGLVTGNMALNFLPYSGIYLVGGVARAMGPYLERFGFLEALQSKGRFSDLMRNFSVYLVTDDYAALRGAAAYISRLGHTR